VPRFPSSCSRRSCSATSRARLPARSRTNLAVPACGRRHAFLDEIGDLPAKGQGDLLRVLEDGCFRMVGGTDLIRVDVRVVRRQQAASGCRERGQIPGGSLLPAAYRPIMVPPCGIEPRTFRCWSRRFWSISAEAQTPAPAVLRGGDAALPALSVAGNVRQLRNAVECLVLTCHQPLVRAEDLPEFLCAHDRNAASFSIRPGMTLAEVESC